jgi:hypothetical protein
MRRFKLINGEGTAYDLSIPASFLQSVDGLGLSRTIKSVQAGYDFIETENELEQKTISGDISFKGLTGYSEYQAFIDFCSVLPLTFCYMPESTWYYIDVTVKRIKKAEIDRKRKQLICPIDFLCMGTWYDVNRSFRAQTSEAEGKTYPYAYSYTYLEITAGSAIVNNTGRIDSPCVLHIFGPAENPSWALIKDGESLLTGKVIATIPEGNKLVINASPKEMEIAEYTASGVYVANHYQHSDFSTERFIIAPVGESVVTFSHEGAEMLNAIVEVKQLAETV